MAPTLLIDEATFDAVVATNVKAPFYLTAAFAPEMAERGSGKIINITTVLAHRGFPGAALYGATKAALARLTQAWAAEYGPGGVSVNAIAPHLVRTAGTEEHLAMLEHVAGRLPARTLAPRTRREYSRDLQNLLDYLAQCGTTQAALVRLRDLEGYLAELERRGLQGSSRNRKTHTLKSFFRYLHAHGRIADNVAGRFVAPRVQKPEPRYLSKEEYRRLLRCCSHHNT